MIDVKIEFEPFIDDATKAFIIDGIDYYNISSVRLPEYWPVNYLLRGGGGDVLGGVIGQLWGGWLQIFYLWVSEAARGFGHGSRLMESAEAYARSRGAIGATLETYSFQARPFYERLGYELCGSIERYPPGYAKFFMKKTFEQDSLQTS